MFRRRTVFALALAATMIAACNDDAPTQEPSHSVSATIELGAGPLRDVTTDSATHLAYVTSGDDRALMALDATSRTRTITLPAEPAGVAVDSDAKLAPSGSRPTPNGAWCSSPTSATAPYR